jgi:hypothetical protein
MRNRENYTRRLQGRGIRTAHKITHQYKVLHISYHSVHYSIENQQTAGTELKVLTGTTQMNDKSYCNYNLKKETTESEN